VGLEQLVLSEGGGADGALVGQVSGLQHLAVILGHVAQQLQMVHLKCILKGRLTIHEFIKKHEIFMIGS
jgi:hypothetical protein